MGLAACHTTADIKHIRLELRAFYVCNLKVMEKHLVQGLGLKIDVFTKAIFPRIDVSHAIQLATLVLNT